MLLSLTIVLSMMTDEKGKGERVREKNVIMYVEEKGQVRIVFVNLDGSTQSKRWFARSLHHHLSLESVTIHHVILSNGSAPYERSRSCVSAPRCFR